MKYRKKPVVIEAIQYLGAVNINEIWDAFGASEVYGPVENEPRACISTLEGNMFADVGDWIIRGVKGELYPIKDEIFRETYEAVNDATS